MRTNTQEKEALLLISDGVAMFTSFIIAILLGHQAHQFSLELIYEQGWGFTALFLSTLLLFFIFDLYTLHKVPQRFTHQALTIGSGLRQARFCRRSSSFSSGNRFRARCLSFFM